MKTITGSFQNPDGTPVANGILYLKLSQDAVAAGTAQVSPQVIAIPLDTTGSIPAGRTIFANDELTPSGTFYTVSVNASGGGTVYGPEQFQIVGSSPIALNSITPSSGLGVVSSTAVLQNPTAAQTITGFDLKLATANLVVDSAKAVEWGSSGVVTPDIFINRQSAGVLGIGTSATNASGKLLVANIENVRYAAEFATGSNTGGIQEAINDLPAGGGIVWLPIGSTTLTAGISITKPVTLIGHGKGGASDPSTNNTYIGGTILVNNTTGTDVITISLPAGNALAGVTLKDFQIQGNKNFAGATAGNGIVFAGGASTTQIRDCVVDNVLVEACKSSGLVIKENVFIIKVLDSEFMRNASHGIAVSNSGTGAPSQLRFVNVTCDLNAGDGVNLNGANVSDAEFFGCTISDSTLNGLNVVVGSTNARTYFSGCTFEANAGAGALLKDGYRHVFEVCDILSNGAVGIDSDPPAAANFVNAQLISWGCVFSSNTTADVRCSANQHTAIILYPTPSTLTLTDSSGNAVLHTLNNGSMRVNTPISPTTAGGATMGIAALPFSGIYIGGAATNNIQVTGTATGARTATLPDNTGTVAELNLAQAWTAQQTFSTSLSDTGSAAQVKRLKASNGTALVAGDFALSAGWGSTAAVTSVTGTDQAWQITVTANGTGIVANPTITLTFHDGTWTNAPITVTKMVTGSGSITQLLEVPTATTNVITFSGTPSAGNTYVIASIAIGR